MSAHLADPSPRFDRVSAANTMRAQLHLDGMPISAARHGRRSAPLATEALSSLEALPWLAPSGPGPASVRAGRNSAARERSGLLLHVGLAAAIAVLGGGTWYAAGDTASQPAPAAQQALAPQDNTLEVPARIAAADTVVANGPRAINGAPLAEAQQKPITGPARPEREAAAARIKPLVAAPATARTEPPAPRTARAPAAGQAPAAPAASVTAPLPAPLADTPATTATLRQYRAAMDDCRDAIGAIIRLGDRQRPGRDASPAELASYRLRQQNAEAAKTYRIYLDTLARTMRGANSESFTRQSLERARQTRGYLDTMLADSKASLR